MLVDSHCHLDFPDFQQELDAVVARAKAAFTSWRTVPAPMRGAVVKRWGELLTEHKDDLAVFVTLEAGHQRHVADIGAVGFHVCPPKRR